jgi:hypothetical protein
VKSLAAVLTLVPEEVVTRTLTVPLPAGLVAVHRVGNGQLTPAPGLTPKFTVVAPTTKFDPVMVTTVPPPVGPVDGLIFVTTGAPRATKVRAKVTPTNETATLVANLKLRIRSSKPRLHSVGGRISFA